MIEQDKLEYRLIAELEESGEENVPTLANTALDPDGTSVELVRIQRALVALVENDFARVAWEQEIGTLGPILDKTQSVKLIEDLSEYIVFDQTEKHWTTKSSDWLTIVATDLGLTRGRALIDSLGYRWWRAKD